MHCTLVIITVWLKHPIKNSSVNRWKWLMEGTNILRGCKRWVQSWRWRAILSIWKLKKDLRAHSSNKEKNNKTWIKQDQQFQSSEWYVLLINFLCRPFPASAALTILSSVSRTTEFPVTDSNWLIVPPYASCYCSHLRNLIIWRYTVQLMQPHLFLFFHTQILTVNSSLPVR